MAKAYICAPYRAATKEGIELNIRVAEQFGFHIARMLNNTECFVPHTFVKEKYGVSVEHGEGPVNEQIEKDLIEELDKCDILYICGSVVTKGMLAEVNYARSTGKAVATVGMDWLEQAKEIIKRLDPDAIFYGQSDIEIR